jgi:hypothetical protein
VTVLLPGTVLAPSAVAGSAVDDGRLTRCAQYWASGRACRSAEGWARFLGPCGRRGGPAPVGLAPASFRACPLKLQFLGNSGGRGSNRSGGESDLHSRIEGDFNRTHIRVRQSLTSGAHTCWTEPPVGRYILSKHTECTVGGRRSGGRGCAHKEQGRGLRRRRGRGAIAGP